MARINQGILGGFSGSVANVTGSSWKGIAVMRSKPLSVTNPRTTAQVNNRQRFSGLSKLGAAILTTIVKPLNDRFASQMSGYNLFTMRNKNVFVGDIFTYPENLVIASGKLGDTAISDIATSGSTGLTVTWSTSLASSFQAATDKAYLLALNAQGEVMGVISGSVTRSAGTAVIATGTISVDMNVYLAFLRADGTIVGNTAFASFGS